MKPLLGALLIAFSLFASCQGRAYVPEPGDVVWCVWIDTQRGVLGCSPRAEQIPKALGTPFRVLIDPNGHPVILPPDTPPPAPEDEV